MVVAVQCHVAVAVQWQCVGMFAMRLPRSVAVLSNMLQIGRQCKCNCNVAAATDNTIDFFLLAHDPNTNLATQTLTLR